MVNWAGFRAEAPELAEEGEALFDRFGVILLGTLRKDGWPRISPVEPLLLEGELYLGMIWQSLKARDLLRDPRCTVHSAIDDRMAPHGEFKLYGRGVEVRDLETRSRYGDALQAKIGWRPPEPRYHLFSVDIDGAASFVSEEDGRRVTRWRTGKPVARFRQTL